MGVLHLGDTAPRRDLGYMSAFTLWICLEFLLWIHWSQDGCDVSSWARPGATGDSGGQKALGECSWQRRRRKAVRWARARPDLDGPRTRCVRVRCGDGWSPTRAAVMPPDTPVYVSDRINGWPDIDVSERVWWETARSLREVFEPVMSGDEKTLVTRTRVTRGSRQRALRPDLSGFSVLVGNVLRTLRGALTTVLLDVVEKGRRARLGPGQIPGPGHGVTPDRGGGELDQQRQPDLHRVLHRGVIQEQAEQE